jgi:hypothetical protein
MRVCELIQRIYILVSGWLTIKAIGTYTNIYTRLPLGQQQQTIGSGQQQESHTAAEKST